MLSQELKEHIFKLPPHDRLALIIEIVESLQEAPIDKTERSQAIRRMEGLLKTDQPASTDEEVVALLALRRLEKYGWQLCQAFPKFSVQQSSSIYSNDRD